MRLELYARIWRKESKKNIMIEKSKNNFAVPDSMNLTIKITSMLLLILVIAFSVSGWISVQKERQMLTRILEDHGKSFSHAIAVFCIETLLSEDYPVLDTFLETTGSEREDVLSIGVLHNGILVSEYTSEPGQDCSSTLILCGPRANKLLPDISNSFSCPLAIRSPK